MPEALKIEPNRVYGCMSTVHLFGRKRGDSRLDFLADSDAHIVRGLIGVLEKLFAGQKAKEVLAFDVEGFFHRIGLDQIISVQRRNGQEIPVNIYELGLIYGSDVDDTGGVKVRMTLTAPACPVAGSLPGDVEKRIEAIPQVRSATVDLVWDPPWSKDKMSELARLTLDMM